MTVVNPFVVQLDDSNKFGQRSVNLDKAATSTKFPLIFDLKLAFGLPERTFLLFLAYILI